MKARPLLSHAPSALLLALCLGLAAPTPAQQDYPTRPIRFITAAAQGGTSDILARVFAVHLTDTLKQPVVVDNRASASGVIAGELTANAPPDGYTIFLAYHQHTVNAALNPKLPYHAVNSFTPITQLTSAGLMLVVNPATPVNTLKEFVEWTKTHKRPLNFGSAGIGTGGHLAGELYKVMTGVKAEHIPYKGAGPALMDLIAGQYHFNFSGIQPAQVQVRAGKLRGVRGPRPNAPRGPARPARGGGRAARIRIRRLVRRDRARGPARAHRREASRRVRQSPQPAPRARAHRGPRG